MSKPIRRSYLSLTPVAPKITDVVPVTINWPRQKIVTFLLEQYANNADKAEYLLKLQLWIDVQEKLNEDSEPTKKEDFSAHVKSVVQSFQEFPAEIQQAVIDEHEKGTRKFQMSKFAFPSNQSVGLRSR